jgi:cell division protein FtsQ
MATPKGTAPVKGALILFVILICVFLFLRSSFFNIQEVVVSGNRNVTAEMITASARVPLETNIFMADLKYVALAAEGHPLIKKVEIVRHLPGTLELVVTEREAWAYIPTGESLIVVDADGVYLDKIHYITDPTMPLITLTDMPTPVIGQVVDTEAVSSVAAVYNQLDDSVIAQLSEYHYDKSTKFLTIYTLQGTEIRLGSADERLGEKISAISRTLELEQELAAAGQERLVYLDARYSGSPVIQTN